MERKANYIIFSLFLYSCLSISAVWAITPISYGTQINDKIVRSNYITSGGKYLKDYSFSGNTGDRVFVSMSSDDFDTYLVIVSDKGKIVSYNDDKGNGTGSAISNFVLPNAETYYIWATTREARDIGDFSLVFDKYPDIDKISEDIAVGIDSVGIFGDDSGNFSNGDKVNSYSFRADKNTSYSISSVSETVNTKMYMMDKDDRIEIISNTSKDFGKSVITFVTSDTKDYIIWVVGDSKEGAEYTISVNKNSILSTPLPLLKHESSSLEKTSPQLSTGQYVSTYTVNGVKGQELSISMDSEDLDSQLYLLDRIGNVKTMSDDFKKGEKDAKINKFIFKSNETLVLWATSSFPGEKGEFTLDKDGIVVGGGLSGNVTNLDGDSVGNVLVEVGGYFTYTKNDGSFHMANVAEGTYSLKLSGSHVKTPITIENILVSNDNDTELGDIKLDATIIDTIPASVPSLNEFGICLLFMMTMIAFVRSSKFALK